MRKDGSLSNLLHRTLVVPAALAVTTFGPACGDATGPTTATTGQTEPGTSQPTTTPTSTVGTTTTTTTTGTTLATTAASTTGGELPDCALYNADPETCSSMVACLYLGNEMVCIPRCNNFTDQTACEMQMYCYWAEGGCYLAV